MTLQLQNIDMAFGANQVLHDVTFNLAEGEIHALLGENGAGKSTLLNILGGVHTPRAGKIILNGEEKYFSSPADSISAGIAFIHQELNLINDLTVYENLYIGNELKRGPFLDHRRMKENTVSVLKRMNVDVEPTAIVGQLDASYKQIIEIARAVLFDAKIIIMDEPTTSLTNPEIARVFELMRTLKGQGVSIIFVSHKLREVMEICDSFTVLRNGVKVKDGEVRNTNELELAMFMVGHEVSTKRLSRRENITDEILRVHNLTGEPYYRNINFSLKRGEILGFTGLLGDGRSELFQTIFGYLKTYSGEIFKNGAPVKIASTAESAALGIGYVPRDRRENGILKDLTILENGSIVTYPQLGRPFIRHKKERAQMREQIDALKIKLVSEDDPITSLSGGNQQKVVLSKWLSAKPEILIFDNPTQGVDVGAKEEIYSIIMRLAEAGVAIVILSSEAQEIVRLCDRALVMYHGEVRGELAGELLTEDQIMVYATGSNQEG